MGIRVPGLTTPLMPGNAQPWPQLLSLLMWAAQRGLFGTPDPLLPGGSCSGDPCREVCGCASPSPGDPAPHCWHRTGTAPAPPLPPTWIGPATWETPRHSSATTPLLPVFFPRVSQCACTSSSPVTSSPSPRGTAAGRVLERLCATAAPAESAPGEDALRGSSALTWD